MEGGWTEEAVHTLAVSHKPKVTFSDNVTSVILANPTPRRATMEVANLDPITVVGNNGSPARKTRAKFAVVAAALAAIVIVTTMLVQNNGSTKKQPRSSQAGS